MHLFLLLRFFLSFFLFLFSRSYLCSSLANRGESGATLVEQMETDRAEWLQTRKQLEEEIAKLQSQVITRKDIKVAQITCRITITD